MPVLVDDLLRAVGVDAAAQDAGIPLPMVGVVHDFGRVIEPARLCQHLAGPTPLIVDARISGISRNDQALTLLAEDGRQFSFDQIVVATGASLPETLHQLAIAGVKVDITTGQVSHIPKQPSLNALKLVSALVATLPLVIMAFTERRLIGASRWVVIMMPFAITAIFYRQRLEICCFI